jgi:hypothetical protein
MKAGKSKIGGPHLVSILSYGRKWKGKKVYAKEENYKSSPAL